MRQIVCIHDQAEIHPIFDHIGAETSSRKISNPHAPTGDAVLGKVFRDKLEIAIMITISR